MRFWKKTESEVPSPLVIWGKSKAALLNGSWAIWMASLAGKLTVMQQKIAAIIMCLLAGSYCISLIIGGLTSAGGNTFRPIKAIARPVAPNRETLQADPYEKDKEKVVALRHYIDSLRQDPNGRLHYDSIQKFRPGLLDTLQILEHYYQSE
ncbi:MAG: hypothetical protein ACLGH8_15065 [Bacteroidia bacterium]